MSSCTCTRELKGDFFLPIQIIEKLWSTCRYGNTSRATAHAYRSFWLVLIFLFKDVPRRPYNTNKNVFFKLYFRNLLESAHIGLSCNISNPISVRSSAFNRVVFVFCLSLICNVISSMIAMQFRVLFSYQTCLLWDWTSVRGVGRVVLGTAVTNDIDRMAISIGRCVSGAQFLVMALIKCLPKGLNSMEFCKKPLQKRKIVRISVFWHAKEHCHTATET